MFLIATLLSATPVMAQTQAVEKDNNPAPRWLVNCNNQANPDALSCAMSHSIFRTLTRQRIVAVNIFPNAQGRFVMRLTLPHGLNFSKGVSLAIDDGASTAYAINTADTNGAYALIPLNDELVAAMKAGNKAVLGIVNVSGNNINMEISLAGFSSSLGLLNS